MERIEIIDAVRLEEVEDLTRSLCRSLSQSNIEESIVVAKQLGETLSGIKTRYQFKYNVVPKYADLFTTLIIIASTRLSIYRDY